MANIVSLILTDQFFAVLIGGSGFGATVLNFSLKVCLVEVIACFLLKWVEILLCIASFITYVTETNFASVSFFVRYFYSVYILNLEPEIFPNKRSKASWWIF